MFDASFVAAVPEGFEGTLREGVLPWQPISVLVSDIVSPSSLLLNDVVLVLGIQILGFAGQTWLAIRSPVTRPAQGLQ